MDKIRSRQHEYYLRSKVIKKSMTNDAVSKRNRKKTTVNYGIITKHGWTIWRNMWCKKKINTVKKFLDKLNKNVEPKEYALRGDLNRMALPQSLLSKSCIQFSLKMTESLELNLPIRKMVAWISCQGSTRQSFHRDTKTLN